MGGRSRRHAGRPKVRSAAVIVVDSSVWIAQLQGRTSLAVTRLAAIERPTTIVIGDLVLMEVLQGARDAAHASKLERSLRRFPIARMVDDRLAVLAAANSRFLRGKGVTIRKTIDLLIATFCIEQGHALLHQDRDFDQIAKHLPLTVI